MKIHLNKIPEEGQTLRGALPSDLLNIPEFKPSGPIQYEVDVLLREDNLLVRGRLEVPGHMDCTRCLLPLETGLCVEEFTVLVESPKEESVDLTDSIREDILLALPAYAKCRLGDDNRCPITGESWDGLDEDKPAPSLGGQWSALDKLRLGGQDKDKE